jgi:hypothetical protein
MSGRDEPPEDAKRVHQDPADLIGEPDLRRLFHYWCARRLGRLMPTKDDIDPLDIGWALSRIFLLDFDPEDGFRYRLAGDDIARVFGRGNLKGLHLSEVLPVEHAAAVEQYWRQLVKDRCVLIMRGMVYLGADQTAIGERLILPLANDEDDCVTGFLGMTVCEWLTGSVPVEVKTAHRQTIQVASIP